MKNIMYKFLTSLIGLMIFLSCDSYFDDINKDPDEPTELTPELILPQVETRLAYTLAGDLSRYLGIYTQHVDGESRQFEVLHDYGITGSDIDQVWNNLYSGTMMDNRQVLEGATEIGLNHIVGISKAIEAYSMLLVTDFWGDAPYSESFKGVELKNPKYDSQESIFNAIFSLLNESRTALNLGVGPYDAGSSDVIYGGNVAKWKNFCNVLEARARLHLAKRDNGNYQLALDALNKGAFSGSADDAEVKFGEAPTEQSPWYQYINERDDCETGEYFKSIMVDLDDPRDTTYGAPHDITDNEHPVFKKDQPVVLLSYTEMKFIEAECKFNVSGASAAYDDYLEGIKSSFAEAGHTTDEYDTYITNTEVNPGASNLTLEQIMTQKYIALYTQPEVFNDWRRTNIPALTPNTGNRIPRRLPYADVEVKSNPNTPSVTSVNLFTPVWWDQ